MEEICQRKIQLILVFFRCVYRLAEIKGIGEKRLDLVMETVETYLMEGAVEEN